MVISFELVPAESDYAMSMVLGYAGMLIALSMIFFAIQPTTKPTTIDQMMCSISIYFREGFETRARLAPGQNGTPHISAATCGL